MKKRQFFIKAIEIGKDKTIVLVAESGSRGGYAFRFDTGYDKEVWFIADSDKRDQWNIRVSVKSLNLALNGYYKVKENILNFLINELEVQTPIGQKLKERISRFDYCVDFETDNFKPEIECLVAHSKSIRKFNADSNNFFEFVAKGKLIESIRIGSMPNKQLAIYNKTKEIIARNKKYWWKIWGIEKNENYKKQIWRIEARAGKKELNNWNIRKFEDLENKAGDVILSIFKSIRYVKPNNNDSNNSRWENEEFWNVLIEEANNNLFDYISNAERKEILEGRRNDLLNIFEKQLSGSITSYAALLGKKLDELPAVIEYIKDDAIADLKSNKEAKAKKFFAAIDKYSQLK